MMLAICICICKMVIAIRIHFTFVKLRVFAVGNAHCVKWEGMYSATQGYLMAMVDQTAAWYTLFSQNKHDNIKIT